MPIFSTLGRVKIVAPLAARFEVRVVSSGTLPIYQNSLNANTPIAPSQSRMPCVYGMRLRVPANLLRPILAPIAEIEYSLTRLALPGRKLTLSIDLP